MATVSDGDEEPLCRALNISPASGQLRDPWLAAREASDVPGPPAATWCDLVLGVDLHAVMVPTPGGPVPVPIPHPYLGLVGDPVGAAVGAFTSPLISVCTGAPPSPPKGITLINGLPAATTNDTARNLRLLPHLPLPPGALFQKQPDGSASLPLGSQTVVYGGGSVVRLGEIAR